MAGVQQPAATPLGHVHSIAEAAELAEKTKVGEEKGPTELKDKKCMAQNFLCL